MAEFNLNPNPISDVLSSLFSWGGTPQQNAVMSQQQQMLADQNFGLDGSWALTNQALAPSTANVGGPGFFQSDFMKGALGYKDANGVQQQGWGAPLLGAISGIGQSWLGMQQLDLARDQFALKKDLALTNLANQQKLTNASLEDRQRARLGANPTGYQSVGDYMKKNGV